MIDLKPFPLIDAHPQTGVFGRDYYPKVYEGRSKDLSFSIGSEAICLCSLIDGTIGYYGLPLRIFATDQKAISAVFTRLDELAKEHSATTIQIREPASGTLGEIGNQCLKREATATTKLIGCVNLFAGPDVWRSSLRKRFKQFVNWGQKNLIISYVNGENYTEDQFDRYRNFHALIAGRVTRPIGSWDAMKTHIKNGGGELILGELDGQLVAATLFMDGTDTTIYMSGTYDRDTEKPISHYMIWHGIERAAQRGMKIFHVGDIHLKDAVDEKNFQIGYFKRGFTTHIDAYTDWTITREVLEDDGAIEGANAFQWG